VESTEGKCGDRWEYMELELHSSPERQEFGNERGFQTTLTQLQVKDMKYICMCVKTMTWRGQDAMGAGGLLEGAVGKG
jgi:hypothetical protein